MRVAAVRRGLAATSALAVAYRTTSADSAPPPPLCGTGKAACPPPVVLDSNGHAIPLRLVQVQCAFRHGARTPVEDAGSLSDGCRWLPEDTEKADILAGCGKVRRAAPSEQRSAHTHTSLSRAARPFKTRRKQSHAN